MVISSKQESKPLTLFQKITSAGLAGCTADLVTFPLDTVKVWLQVKGETPIGKIPTAKREFPDRQSPSSASLTSERQTPPSSKNVKPGSVQPSSVSKKSGKQEYPTQLHNQKQSKKNKVNENLRSSSSGQFHQHKRDDKSESSQKVLNKAKSSRNFSRFAQLSSKEFRSVREGSDSVSIFSQQRKGLFATILKNVRLNGYSSLYGGIAAGLQRQVAFCAVRIGLYDSVKGFYLKLLPGSQNSKQIGQRILAGTTTAFVAVALFQPTEVVKIRMQAQTSKPLETRLYSSSFQAYRALFNVGVKEAWKGIETNATRLAVVNVCELVTYDVVKETILDYRLMNDNPACHFTSAFLSGFITTVVASPIDVVKTRYMNSKEGHYKGPVHCAKNMLLTEGVAAFYKGFVPAYLRLGSWNIVMFLSYEQYKRLFELYNHQHEGSQNRNNS